VLLYILYTVKIGGDFMSGRFLAAPLLCAVIALTDVPFSRIGSRTMLILFAALTIIGFRAPIPTVSLEGGDRALKINEHGIADERLYYFKNMGLVNYKIVDGVPTLSDVESGLRAREESKKDYYILPKSNVGVSGFYAGPNVHYIDMFALADPLLARLPPVRNLDWRIGHFHRIIPQGYVESIYNNESLLKDPNLAEYYEYLRLITRGNFFDPDRWEKIWKMNTGQYDYLIDREKYYLPETVDLTKNQAENLEKAISFEDDGVLVDLGEVQHAGKIQINLGNRDGFILSFRLKGEEIATLETPQDTSSEDMVQMLMDVPPAAVESGYDSIRVLPSAGDDPFRMSSLTLID
jgi:arabinofuranosyltransferase